LSRFRAGVVLLLLALSSAAALTSGRQLFANLAYVLAFLIVLALVWSHSSLGGISLVRKARTLRTQVGLPFEEQFFLHNGSRIPKVWLELQDESTFPEHRVSSVLTSIGGWRDRRWTVRTLCQRRGRFRLGPYELRAGDPFGLFPRVRRVEASQAVVVLPMVLPLGVFPVPSGRRGGGEALRLRTHQVTPNASGVRDYAPGDALNRIHWPSTARRRRLIAKEFELDPLSDAWVLIDASAASQSSLPEVEITAPPPLGGRRVTIPPETIEYAVTAGASIAHYLLDRGQSVGLIAHGQTRHMIQADRGTAQLYRILETLAVLEPVGRLGLSDVLRVEQAQIPRGAAVIIITGSVQQEVVETAQLLRRSGLPPVLVLLDASSFGGPQGSQALLHAAGHAGIPTRLLQCGEPIPAGLESTMRQAYAAVA
jgi:uncharacterized protein (DUF58 family)